MYARSRNAFKDMQEYGIVYSICVCVCVWVSGAQILLALGAVTVKINCGENSACTAIREGYRV
jgi:hypothetical protein